MGIKELSLEGTIVSKKSKKRYLKFAIPAVGALLLFVVGVTAYLSLVMVPSTKELTTSVKGAYDQIEKVKEAIKEEDISKIKEETTKLKEELKIAQHDLDNMSFVKYMPMANGYYNDAKHMITAGVAGAEAGEIIISGITPFADVLGLKGKEAETTADEKTAVIVKEVLPILPSLLVELEQKLNTIDEELSQVDPHRYPSSLIIKGFKVRDGLIEAQSGISKVQKAMPDIESLVTVAPEILGASKEKKYLILFQNDKELRATGGFITSYAIARIKEGKLMSVDSEGIYDLDKRFSTSEPPPDPLRKYLLLRYYPIRDANISPDYLVSARKFESFYNTIPGIEKVDGVIALDTEFVRTLIEFTGPIKVDSIGETFSAETNQYGISDVVYKMELYAQKVFKGNSDRKSFIGDLMDGIIEEIMNTPPEKFESLFELFLAEANEKHVQFYLHNQEAQRLIERVNFGGRIKEYDGDYLHVNNSNFAGLKANFFITQKIEQDIITSADGTITKKVEITLTNPSNQLVGWLNSNYRNFMRVYIPDGSKLIDEETEADFKQSEDLDKKVFESFSTTAPLTSSTTIFTYELPFKVKPGEEYKMMIQKQAGTRSTEMIIRLNGNVIEEFDLTVDKEIKFII